MGEESGGAVPGSLVFVSPQAIVAPKVTVVTMPATRKTRICDASLFCMTCLLLAAEGRVGRGERARRSAYADEIVLLCVKQK